jgi:hypothetical protein
VAKRNPSKDAFIRVTYTVKDANGALVDRGDKGDFYPGSTEEVVSFLKEMGVSVRSNFNTFRKEEKIFEGTEFTYYTLEGFNTGEVDNVEKALKRKSPRSRSNPADDRLLPVAEIPEAQLESFLYDIAQEVRQDTADTLKDTLPKGWLNTREQREVATAVSRAFETICLKYLRQQG